MEKYRSIILPAIIIIALGAGIGIGRGAGSLIVRGLLMERTGASLVFFKPAAEFIHTYRLLNSAAHLDRLGGYYSLLDNNMILDNFLFDRFAAEETDINRKTILWILGHSGRSRKVLDFYSEIYGKSGGELKRIILRNTKRMGEETFHDFVRQNGISEEEVEKLLL